MTKKRLHSHAFGTGPIRIVHRARRGGHSARFHGSVMTTVTQSQATSSHSSGTHEAHMIPGIDGNRIWGFPNSIVTKLRYATYLDLSASGGVVAQNVFAANGLYDPDISLGGHQPMYFDNYTNLYDQYVVLGSKIICEYQSASATIGQYCGIAGDDDATTSTNVETLMEMNNSVSRLCPPAGGPILALTQTFEPLAQVGIDAKGDGTAATPVGQNPTELWCYKVWCLPSDLSTTVHCYVKVTIEYTVKFSELKTPTQN